MNAAADGNVDSLLLMDDKTAATTEQIVLTYPIGYI